MTVYGHTLAWLFVLFCVAVAGWLFWLAFRTTRPRQPDPAAWNRVLRRERERNRHHAPASAIPVVLRTDPFLRRAEISALAPQRLPRHSPEYFQRMVQTTCWIHGLPELLRQDRL